MVYICHVPPADKNKTSILKSSCLNIQLTVAFKFLLQFTDLVTFYPVSRQSFHFLRFQCSLQTASCPCIYHNSRVCFVLFCFVLFFNPAGNFFHLFTSRTQALQISPDRVSCNPKQLWKSFSQRLLSVNRELEDLALQIQQPSILRYIFGL